MTATIVGIDCGGTSIRARIAFVEHGSRLRLTFPPEYPDIVVASQEPKVAFARLIEGLSEWPIPQNVCIACFGPICLDPDSESYGCVCPTPKPYWAGFPVYEALRAYYQERSGRDGTVTPSIRVVHDVVAPAAYCAVSDATKMQLRDGVLETGEISDILRPTRTVYMTVGTGVGLAPCIPRATCECGDPSRRLLSQLFFTDTCHTEIGHVVVPLHAVDLASGFQCQCPFHTTERLPGMGCVEGLTGAPAVAARLGVPQTRLEEAGISSSHPVWECVAYYLAHAVHAALLAWRPERVVIGGGLARVPGLVSQIAAQLELINNNYVSLPRVDPDESQCAGLLGACILAAADLC